MKSKQTNQRIQWKSRLKILKPLTIKSVQVIFHRVQFLFLLTLCMVYHRWFFKEVYKIHIHSVFNCLSVCKIEENTLVPFG